MAISLPKFRLNDTARKRGSVPLRALITAIESSALPSSTKITSQPLVAASSTGRSASSSGTRLRASLNTGTTTLSSMSGLVLTA